MTDYEDIKLEELDTTRFLVDPKLSGFANALKKKDKAFGIDIEAGLSETKVLRYIALMYDPSSELRNNIPHLPSRKRICAKVAGFEIIEHRFSQSVEKMLTGGYKKVNEAIIRYCFLTYNIYFVAHAAFQNMYFNALADSFQSFDKDTIKNINDLQDKLVKNEEKIFGGDEATEIVKALYVATSKIELGIKPEEIVKKLESGDDLNDMNPYEDGYKPNKLTYAGVEPPK